MPTYRYAIQLADGTTGAEFEVDQSMSDAPLDAHPETGEPVTRVFTAPNLVLRHGSNIERARMSDSNLDRLGFTKYVKAADGRYEKTAGAGPQRIING